MTTLNKSATYKLSSGYEIPIIGLGVYQTPAESTAKVVKAALERGFRHIDTAQNYQNEDGTCVGISQWLKESGAKREAVFLTTKVDQKFQNYEKAKNSIDHSFKIASAHGLEYLDLVLLHFPGSTKEDRLGAYTALQEAKDSGKIKSIGVSNYGVEHLKELLHWDGLKHPPVVNQVELHPWLMREELVHFCVQNDILLEAYSPLARCLKNDDAALQKLAASHNATPAQILINWSLRKGFITLPKTVNSDRMEENLKAFDVALDGSEVESLNHPNEHFLSQGGQDPTLSL